MTETALDTAQAATAGEPDNTLLRLAFLERVVATELFVMIEDDAGDAVAPVTFPTSEGAFVLAFDREDRLAEFAGGAAPYAAVSGRGLLAMLKDSDLGIGLNLQGNHAELLDVATLGWLRTMLAEVPEDMRGSPIEVDAPRGLPDRLIAALDARLAGMEGLALRAHLASVTYSDGGRGTLLAVVGVMQGREAAITRGIGETLVFSGLEAGALDVTFVEVGHPLEARLSKVALTFELPEVHGPEAPKAPGMDPDTPPRLR